jgi:hypothetical protein
MMVEALGVDPRACFYLADLGVNLKPAQDMGCGAQIMRRIIPRYPGRLNPTLPD